MKKWFFKTEIVYQESYAWLDPLKKMLHYDFCVFDQQGNIVASTLKEKKRHVLDLFSNTCQAQTLLRQMDAPGEGTNPGQWINGHGQKRFLYRVA